MDGAGGFHCNGCGAKGNIFQFQAKVDGISLQDAANKVAEITGAARDAHASKLGPPVAIYDYRAPDGRVLFQKRRYEPVGEKKTFITYHPASGGLGWVKGIDSDSKTTRILYNLHLVITANVCAVVEGEKDADNVAAIGIFADRPEYRVATTCNFDGAWKPGQQSKWLPEYNAFFAGKVVLIFVDNDEAGEAWSQAVAEGVAPFAHTVKRIKLPGLAPKGDVSDWLIDHSVKELEDEIRKTRSWEPPKIESLRISQDMVEFASQEIAPVRWLIGDVIPHAGNGIVCGDPKASKSFHALDIGISLACGVDWLGRQVPRRAKTYLVSREDSPGLTQRRVQKLLRGRAEYANLEGWMRINTRRHTADFKVTNADHLYRLIEDINKFGAELCILDVFRSIHDVKENDNDEMPVVLEKVNRIQNECGCAVALVHHISKAVPESIFRGLRGASAIHGWMEWGIGISVTNPEEEDKHDYIRKVEFENKEGVCVPVYTQIEGRDPDVVRIVKVQPKATATRNRASVHQMEEKNRRRFGNDD